MNFLRLKGLGTKKGDHVDEIRRVVATVLEDEQQLKQLLEARGEDAQIWLNSLQVVAELPEIESTGLRSSILKVMLKLSKRTGLAPDCLNIKNVTKQGQHPIGGGGFGDVWKGKVGERIVCLKVVRDAIVRPADLDPSTLQDLLKGFKREALLWKQLESHPNILPFLGMYHWENAPGKLCLVSPWMEAGNLTKFLETNREGVDLLTLAHDVACGLKYLHGEQIIHGDLKGLNILVRTPEPRACIGDFGLSRVSDNQAVNLSITMQSRVGGTTRWLSPELLTQPCSMSKESDVYAYGCVCYEIFTGKVPFFDKSDPGVILDVVQHKKNPVRPRHPILNNNVWDLMVACWSYEPHSRPTVDEVLTRITSLENSKPIVPAPNWDPETLIQIRKNVKYPSNGTLAEQLTRLHKPLISGEPSESMRRRLEAEQELIQSLQNVNQQPEKQVKLKVHFQSDTFRLDVSPSIIHSDLVSKLCAQIVFRVGDECDPSKVVIQRENELYPGHFITLVTDADVRIALRKVKDGIVPVFVSCTD